MDRVRVVIVADDPLARAGMAALLANLPDIVVAGQISSAEDLETAVETARPDVMLWDTGWRPEVVLARLADAPKGLPTVTLISDVAEAVQAWQEGSHGILSRDATPARIGASLQAVVEGLTVIEGSFRDALIGHAPPTSHMPQLPADEPPLIEELTPRELEVLRLLAEGLPNKTLAHRLDISEHTVKFHVNAVLGKLGAGSRTEAVVRATRLGLIFL